MVLESVQSLQALHLRVELWRRFWLAEANKQIRWASSGWSDRGRAMRASLRKEPSTGLGHPFGFDVAALYSHQTGYCTQSVSKNQFPSIIGNDLGQALHKVSVDQ